VHLERPAQVDRGPGFDPAGERLHRRGAYALGSSATRSAPALRPVNGLLVIVGMLSVKISTKHQIAVPSEARRKLGLKTGDQVDVEIEGDVIHLRRHVPAGTRLYSIGAHLYDGTDPAERIRAMRDADQVRWVERQVEIDADIRAEYAARQEFG
jgi:AbrB family looped-hinge helix DNA binding protein